MQAVISVIVRAEVRGALPHLITVPLDLHFGGYR